MRRKNTETKKAEQEWKRKTELKQRLTEREEARWKKRKDIHARELERGRRERERQNGTSERRQRPFFDKLVTRRHPAAKGARG